MKLKLITAVVAAVAAQSASAQNGVLNVYNWSDYIAEDTLEKFTAATGIAVNYDVFDSNEVLEAKMLAGNSGYDVVVPTSSFMQRQIAAGVYQPLNRDLLPNLANMDPALMEAAASYDPSNEHSVIYMWGTTGIGYNAGKVEELLGEDAPTNSWALVFDPANAEKLAACGITLLDAPVEMLPAAMNYLGLDPQSTDAADFEKGAELLMTIRPYIRYFHSSQYINDLANGEVCVSIGWSGDIFIAQARAAEAENGIEIAYVIPDEGALQWFDMLTIPVDAPNPEAAHAFINFIMDAQITADITNYVWYANANAASLPLVEEDITSDPGIFPTPAAKERLWNSVPYDSRLDRAITRLWTTILTGQ
ncbi:MAG: polyamine ABC transporter substrate-binding protein [Paracoccaceae bacterium]